MSQILNAIYSVIGSYGWTMVIFTIIIRFVLLPFDIKSRTSMRKMSALQPKMLELQNRYKNDPEKLQRKMSELYRSEHASPMSGCLPMLLSYPLLIWMFNAMRGMANEQIVQQVIAILQQKSTTGELPKLESWFWIKSIWMPDSPFSSVLPDLNALRVIGGDVWQRFMTPEVIATLPEALQSLTTDSFANANVAATINQIYEVLEATPTYIAHAGTLPGWTFNLLFFQVSIMKEINGWFLLPIISAGSQYFMMKMQPTQPAATSEAASQQQSSMKMMNWFMPIFTLWLCSSYNGAFAIYWTVSNLVAIVQNFLINRYLDNKDAAAKAAAVEGEGTIR